MLLNCGAGEDSAESLGLQGNPTSPSERESTLNIHWKDWCWSWSSNTLVTWCKVLTHWKKTLMLGKFVGRRRRGQQRGLDSITDLMDINLSKLQEIVEDRGAWCAAVHGITKSLTQLSDWTAKVGICPSQSPNVFMSLERYSPLSSSLNLGWSVMGFGH